MVEREQKQKLRRLSENLQYKKHGGVMLFLLKNGVNTHEFIHGIRRHPAFRFQNTICFLKNPWYPAHDLIIFKGGEGYVPDCKI